MIARYFVAIRIGATDKRCMMAKDKKTTDKTDKPDKSKADVDEAAVTKKGITARSLMPTSAKDKAVLKQRAAMLAGEADDEYRTDKGEGYLRLRLGKTEEYGIPYEYLDEVLYVSAISRIPALLA